VGGFSFTRNQRLLNATAYAQVFDQVEAKVSHQAFLILASRSEPTQPGRVGLIAAKKHLKRAVDRNSFKRQVRDSFRLHQQELAGINIVVMARSGAKTLARPELRTAIDEAWPRLIRRLSKAPDPSRE